MCFSMAGMMPQRCHGSHKKQNKPLGNGGLSLIGVSECWCFAVISWSQTSVSEVSHPGGGFLRLNYSIGFIWLFFRKKKAPSMQGLYGGWSNGGIWHFPILKMRNRFFWIGYILNFLRDAPASPSKPVPSRRMVVGSGTGAGPTSPSRTAHAY